MLKKWEIEKIEQKKNAFGTKFRLSLKTNIFGTKKSGASNQIQIFLKASFVSFFLFLQPARTAIRAENSASTLTSLHELTVEDYSESLAVFPNPSNDLVVDTSV